MALIRSAEQDLNAWRTDSIRKPLLVRGARQVGKSWLIESFGKQYFKNTVVVNFEVSPEYKKCFQTLQPDVICNMISVIAQQPIKPGETLLFLDEIQDCAEAIQALRYFKEQMSTLHVIAAGSLLELALNQAKFRMPVGRVSFLYLHPVSFREFLQAFHSETIDYLKKATLKHPVPDAIHDYLLAQLKYYFWLGGMPEVLSAYHEKKDLSYAQAMQASVVETYEKDFGHYNEVAHPAWLQHCFNRVPLLIGQQIKYNKLDPDIRSRDLKQALTVLENANILQRVYSTTGSGLPLDTTNNEKKFKLNFIDVGLVKRFNQLDASLLLNDHFIAQNQGALTEQFVGQELLAYAPTYEKTKLYYWTRDVKGSVAELDYIVTYQGNIFPLEVKSGKLGKLKSLHQFMQEYPKRFGIRVSTNSLSFQQNILTVPLYMLHELPRLITEI